MAFQTCVPESTPSVVWGMKVTKMEDSSGLLGFFEDVEQKRWERKLGA